MINLEAAIGASGSELGADIKRRWSLLSAGQRGGYFMGTAALAFLLQFLPGVNRQMAVPMSGTSFMLLLLAGRQFQKQEQLEQQSALAQQRELIELDHKLRRDGRLKAALENEQISATVAQYRRVHNPEFADGKKGAGVKALIEGIGEYLDGAEQEDVGLSEEDLAQTIADAYAMILVIAPSQCGKSSLLNAIVCYGAKQNPQPDFKVSDAKRGKFGGVEKSPNDYVCIDGPYEHQAISILGQLEGLIGIATQRFMARQRSESGTIEGIPVLFLIDEYNNQHVFFKTLGKEGLEKGAAPWVEQLKQKTSQLLTQGLEGKVRAVITSHTTRVERVGMDTSLQDALQKVVLARRDDYSELYEGLDKWVPKVEQEKLKNKLTAYRESKDRNPETPVALTNVNGPWRLVTLPKYDKNAKAEGLGIHNSSTEDYLARQADETLAEKRSQPSTPTPSKEPSDSIPKPEPNPTETPKSPAFPVAPMPAKGSEFLHWLIEQHDYEPAAIPDLFELWGSAHFENIGKFAQFLGAIVKAGFGEISFKGQGSFKAIHREGMPEPNAELTAQRIEAIKQYLERDSSASARDIQLKAPNRRTLFDGMAPDQIRLLFQLIAKLDGYETEGGGNQLKIRKV